MMKGPITVQSEVIKCLLLSDLNREILLLMFLLHFYSNLFNFLLFT